MRGFLALLVWASATIPELPAHGAKPSIGLDRQDDEIAADIVGDDEVASRRIHRQMGRDWALKGLSVEQLDHPGIRVDRIGLGRAALLPS
jgi:hypothetical protein